MAKIPLRSYNREIEAMIDRGQTTQAVDHCLHILKFFPKHIDTYRLLGKAFLEMQKYHEAADVLQRVLACVPDDFISQIGMGIIREDEGNLDAAIWYMERAFEVQPSNIGVRDELRRLYGKRDGAPPEKIRLTRGALIRMYARGELYQQAIAEIRVALVEDPQRVDLEALLARMYFLSGQKVAATEVCTRLITKLPFCFEANRILAAVLPETSRAEDAKRYLARVHAMDPYLAHLTPETLSSAEVPDNAVELDRLEWVPEYGTSQPADWAKVIGAEWTTEGEAIPDWITGAIGEDESASHEEQTTEQPPVEETPVTEAVQSEAPFTVEIPSEEEIPESWEEPEGADQIPDWMKQAGWQPASGEAAEEPSGYAEQEEPAVEEEPAEEIEQAEIPDWLAALAPAEEPQTEETEEPESTEWLQSILPETPEIQAAVPGEGELTAETPLELEPEEIGSQPGEEEIQQPESEPAVDFEEFVKTGEASAAAGFPAQAESVEGEFQAEETLPAESGLEQPAGTFLEEEPAAGEIQPPDWLASLQTPTQEQPGEGETELPSWLEELMIETPQPAQDESRAPQEEFLAADQIEPVAESSEEPVLEQPETTPEVGSWVDLGDTQPVRIKREEPPAPISEPEIESAPEISAGEPEFEETMSWLEQLTASEAEEEESPSATPAEPGQEWIPEITPEEQPAVEPPEETERLVPDWMQEIASGEVKTGESAEAGPITPDWMQEFAAEEGAQIPAEQAETSLPCDEFETYPRAEEMVEETEGIGAIFEEEFQLEEPTFGKAEVEEEVGTPEEAGEEGDLQAEGAAPEPSEIEIGSSEQFLEALGSLQGEAAIEPEEKPTPEAVQPQIEEAALEAEQPQAEEAAEEELPEWLRQMMAGEAEEEAEITSPEIAPLSEPGTEDALGWLQELSVEEETPAGEPQTEAEAESIGTPEIPGAFMEEESILKPDETPEGLPEWLRGVDEEKGVEETFGDFGFDRVTASVESAEEEPEWPTGIASVESAVEDTSPIESVSEVEISETSSILKQAQAALEAHNIERALEYYDELIKSGQNLEDIIHDLRDALYRYPIDVSIWQLLGDAYMKSNRLQDALDAYTKAEELLR